MMTCAAQLHAFFARIFWAGLAAVVRAQRDGADPVLSAVQAMRNVLQDLPLLVARGMHSPYAFQRAAAARSMAGYMRPHVKMYPSVRWVLGEDGDPRTVLLERLPAYVLEAQHTGARGVDELVKSVRRLVNQARRSRRAQSLYNAPGPVLERRAADSQRQPNAPSALEDWYAQQEVIQRLDALIPHARLSPREAEVLSLQRAGLSHAAIASQLGVKKGSVKRFTDRIKKKLKSAGS